MLAKIFVDTERMSAAGASASAFLRELWNWRSVAVRCCEGWFPLRWQCESKSVSIFGSGCGHGAVKSLDKCRRPREARCRSFSGPEQRA